MSVYRHAAELNEKAISLTKEYEKLSENYGIFAAPDIIKPKTQKSISQTRVAIDTDISVKTVPEPPELKGTDTVFNKIADESLTNEGKRAKLLEEIENHNISIKLNHEKQAPHIYGSKEYDPSRNKSYFTISEEELQNIIYQKYGTGNVIIKKSGQIKETVELENNVGTYMGIDGSNIQDTNRITIHYSKNRTHMVPSRKSEEKDGQTV